MPYIGNIPATQFAALTYQDLTGAVFTKTICKKIQPNDIILFIGAGDISKIANDFAESFN